jgi:hypothetical protein
MRRRRGRDGRRLQGRVIRTHLARVCRDAPRKLGGEPGPQWASNKAVSNSASRALYLSRYSRIEERPRLRIY